MKKCAIEKLLKKLEIQRLGDDGLELMVAKNNYDKLRARRL